ncbi:C-terminal binding protein [Cryobacterium sp. M23]|uniref:C-terminal binding protein n=1 Tax=Cryobacterium sp. M23 TaxID=2048292 RepID=UPI000CE3075A|nr:C-terminal binding protein [Cryobacterium sp. M23]
MKIVITDCDHPQTAEETAVARAHGVELVLAQCRTEDDVIAAGRDADGLVVQYAPITETVLAALPQLKAIGRYGVGYDTVDVPAATRHGVAVCNVPDYGTEDVSDHAIALAVSLERGIVRFDRQVRHGNSRIDDLRPLHRISTRVFGVVGLGLIGSATARKARGLGYTVIAHDPALPVDGVSSEGIPLVGLDELYATANVVSVHVPLNDATRHLIDSQALGKFLPGAILINTCRGGVVDTDAVVDALASGRLKGAGLDVFEEEPVPANSPLLHAENAVLTPHVAWYSEESYSELKTRTIENVIEVCAGRTPRNILNGEVLV